MEVLEQFKIPITQVYSVTTDNGANMLATVKLLAAEEDLIHINWANEVNEEDGDQPSQIEDDNSGKHIFKNK